MSLRRGRAAGLRGHLLDLITPAPWSELSIPKRGVRVMNIAFAISALAMAAAASTADSDWNLTQADVDKQFG